MLWFGHLPLFGGKKKRACEYNPVGCGKASPSVPEVWGRFSEHHKVLWFTTAGGPQHDPKRNDTWLCAWRFGQVHAGWFMPASSPWSPGANIDWFFFFSAESKWEAAISLFWEPVQMEPAKMQTLLTGSIFLQPNACSQKKFNRLLYWFVIPSTGFCVQVEHSHTAGALRFCLGSFFWECLRLHS